MKKEQAYHTYRIFTLVWLAVFSYSCSNSKEDLDQTNMVVNCNGLYWASLTAGETDELYFGVENKVKLIAPAVSSANIQLAFSGGKGTISRVGGSLYSVKPTSFDGVTITLKIMDTNESKNFTFKVKELPTPFPSLNQDEIKVEGEIKIAKFRELNRIYLSFQNFSYIGNCTIESFQISLIQNGREIRTEQNIGAIFSKKTSDLVSKVNQGDIVIFTQIKGKCAGDTISRCLSPMIWEII